MSGFPWRSILVLGLLAGMYAVSVAWNRYAHPEQAEPGQQAEDAPSPVPKPAEPSAADPLLLHNATNSSPLPSPVGAQGFSATLGGVIEPWAHVPPIGHVRRRFESDVAEFLPPDSFDPSELFAIGAHGHYLNPEVDAAWHGWRLSLVSLSMHDQLAREEPVDPGHTSFNPS